MSTPTDATAEFEAAMQELLRDWIPHQPKSQQPGSNIALFDKALALALTLRDFYRLRDFPYRIPSGGQRFVQSAYEVRVPIPIDWDILRNNWSYDQSILYERGNPSLGYTLGPNGEIVWNEPS